MSLTEIKVNNNSIIGVNSSVVSYDESDERNRYTNLVSNQGIYDELIHMLDSSDGDMNISDFQGNVLVEFKDGHIKTKEFDSRDVLDSSNAIIQRDTTDSDMNIADYYGHVIVEFKDGHIKTKQFDSRNGAGVSQPWNGKKITVLGDSITYGVGASSDATKYPAVIAQITGATVINAGVSGTRISKTSANSFVDRVKDIDTTSDLIIINGGTNDYWHKQTTIGSVDSSDETTLCGALHSIFSWLQDNVPDMRILFVFPFHQYYSGNKDTTDWGYGNFEAFRDAAKSVCDLRGVPFLDLMSTSGVDVANSSQHRVKYSTDGVHLNDAGYNLLAKKIVQYINYTL